MDLREENDDTIDWSIESSPSQRLVGASFTSSVLTYMICLEIGRGIIHVPRYPLYRYIYKKAKDFFI